MCRSVSGAKVVEVDGGELRATNRALCLLRGCGAVCSELLGGESLLRLHASRSANAYARRIVCPRLTLGSQLRTIKDVPVVVLHGYWAVWDHRCPVGAVSTECSPSCASEEMSSPGRVLFH